MLNKLWKSYSYAIILFALSVAAAFIMLMQIETPDKEKFVKVTVAEGILYGRLLKHFLLSILCLQINLLIGWNEIMG